MTHVLGPAGALTLMSETSNGHCLSATADGGGGGDNMGSGSDNDSGSNDGWGWSGSSGGGGGGQMTAAGTSGVFNLNLFVSSRPGE